MMTRHQRAAVDGFSIFYREAGSMEAPAILLLHGFPTSSDMFRNLIPLLADRYGDLGLPMGFTRMDHLTRPLAADISRAKFMEST